MKVSTFSFFLPWLGRWVPISTLSGQAAMLDPKTVMALRKGRLEELPPPLQDALTQLGLLVEDEADELASLALNTSWPERTADVTVITARPSSPTSDAPSTAGLEAALGFIQDLRRQDEVDVAKLRLGGFRGSDIAERRRLLQTARETLAKSGLQLITMWMTDDLREAPEGVDEEADAFFFRWDLRGAPQDVQPQGPVWQTVLHLLRRNKGMIVQLAYATQDDLQRHEAVLSWLSQTPELTRNSQCIWDLAPLGRGQAAYFLPTQCLEALEIADEKLSSVRELLTEKGFPIRPAVSPYRLHPGCVFRWPRTRAFGPGGKAVTCLLDLAEAIAPGPEGESAEPLKARAASLGEPVALAEQIRDCPVDCHAIPLCATRCPRLGKLVPDRDLCEVLQQQHHQELGRLLITRQLPVANLSTRRGFGSRGR